MDSAEGSGTNMMNINTHQWDRKLLEQCGGNSLYEKLNKEPVEGGTLLGNISHYYVERYGFHPGKFFFRCLDDLKMMFTYKKICIRLSYHAFYW